MCWNTRTFSASAGKMNKSLLKIDWQILFFCRNYYGKVFYFCLFIAIIYLFQVGVPFAMDKRFRLAKLTRYQNSKHCIPQYPLNFYFVYVKKLKFTHSSCHFISVQPFQLLISLHVKVEDSLLVTGFGYDHDDAWLANINLFKEFTDISRV